MRTSYDLTWFDF